MRKRPSCTTSTSQHSTEHVLLSRIMLVPLPLLLRLLMMMIWCVWCTTWVDQSTRRSWFEWVEIIINSACADLGGCLDHHYDGGSCCWSVGHFKAFHRWNWCCLMADWRNFDSIVAKWEIDSIDQFKYGCQLCADIIQSLRSRYSGRARSGWMRVWSLGFWIWWRIIELWRLFNGNYLNEFALLGELVIQLALPLLLLLQEVEGSLIQLCSLLIE